MPTIGSEGTSFSLFEAMGSGCACICSNVGGMTNIIIDGYNGFLVNPDSESFCNKIELLVKNKNLRRRVRKNAYKTIKEGFSKEIWEKMERYYSPTALVIFGYPIINVFCNILI